MTGVVVAASAFAIGYLLLATVAWQMAPSSEESARRLSNEARLAMTYNQPVDTELEPRQFLAIYRSQEQTLYLGDLPPAATLLYLEREIQLAFDQPGTSGVEVVAPEITGWTASATSCARRDVCLFIVGGSGSSDFVSFLLDRARLGTFLVSILLVMLVMEVRRRTIGRIVEDLRNVESQVVRVATGEVRSVSAGSLSHPAVLELVAGFNDAVHRYESTLDQEARSLADTAHDLRSPLAASATFVELAMHKASGEYLEHSLAEIKRASSMVDGLLLLSRAGSLAKQKVKIDVAAVVSRDVAAVKFRYLDRQITCDVEQVDGHFVPRALESITVNLIENAAKYSRQLVHVGLHRNGDELRFAVEDDGEGIDDDDLERATGRYQQLLQSIEGSAHTGVGLGLNIVREAVRLEDGVLRLSRSELGGCRFEVTLPLGGGDV